MDGIDRARHVGNTDDIPKRLHRTQITRRNDCNGGGVNGYFQPVVDDAWRDAWRARDGVAASGRRGQRRMMHKNSIASTFLKLIMLMPSSIAVVIISNEYGVIHGVSAFIVACVVGAVLSEDVDSMTGGGQ